jgi:hypothetical protein
MKGFPLFSSTPLCGTSFTTPMIVGQSSGFAGRPPKANFPPMAEPLGKNFRAKLWSTTNARRPGTVSDSS